MLEEGGELSRLLFTYKINLQKSGKVPDHTDVRKEK